ncbi:MAG: TIGR01212 family radical SAM protein [Chlorobi bacterium]|nr:TIGR01212 family radical SAM protein [Chlorobiota bacterium]
MTAEKIYPWGDSRRLNSTAGFYKRLFGERVQKLSIDAGFTCPNRDGTYGRGGCTYCNNDAFNPSYCRPEKSVKQQLEEGIVFHRRRYRRSNYYLAYFQAYSNTYAPPGKLKMLYKEALDVPGVKGLVISTRPDCIDDKILDFLAGMQERYFVAVEYGIESCYDKTLEKINRGHTFSKTEETVRKTAAKGIRTTGHIIFGLPGESRDEMLAEAVTLSALPFDALKFHQLQIVKGTVMAEQYRSNPMDFPLFSHEEYIPFIVRFLERLNPNIQIDRLTGETPPDFLIAPDWGRRRTYTILEEILRYMEEKNTWQGKYYEPVETRILYGKE